MEESIIVILRLVKRNELHDIEVPLDITVRELVVGLNAGYDLGIDVNNIKNCYLKIENPTMLIRGNTVLKDTDIRNGSVINFTE